MAGTDAADIHAGLRSGAFMRFRGIQIFQKEMTVSITVPCHKTNNDKQSILLQYNVASALLDVKTISQHFNHRFIINIIAAYASSIFSIMYFDRFSIFRTRDGKKRLKIVTNFIRSLLYNNIQCLLIFNKIKPQKSSNSKTHENCAKNQGL